MGQFKIKRRTRHGSFVVGGIDFAHEALVERDGQVIAVCINPEESIEGLEFLKVFTAGGGKLICTAEKVKTHPFGLKESKK